MERLENVHGNVTVYIVSDHGSIVPRNNLIGMFKSPDEQPALPTQFNIVLHIKHGSKQKLATTAVLDDFYINHENSATDISTYLKYALDEGPILDTEGCPTSNGYLYMNRIAWITRGERMHDLTDTSGGKWSIINDMYLKLYKGHSQYNDEDFESYHPRDGAPKSFGLLFAYEEGGIFKYIQLSLRYLMVAALGSTIRLSRIFDEISDLNNLSNIDFYFTHASCRVLDDEEGDLTRTRSNEKEEQSLRCFYKYFNEEQQTIIKGYFESQGWKKIFDFYDYLKSNGKFDEWLNFNNDRGKQYKMIRSLISDDPDDPDDSDEDR